MSSAEAVLVAALELLGLGASSTPPIRLLDQRPADVSPEAQAFVRRHPDVIYVLTSTPLFRAALQAGRPDRDRASFRLLASVLAHELWHVRYGDDEREAYHMQLTTLLMLGSARDSPEYHRVTKAMIFALERARRQQPASTSTGEPTVGPLSSSKRPYQDNLGN